VAVLAGDAAMAERALATLDAIGTRGRATDGDRATIRAGLAALAGDPAAAMAGYRTAMGIFQGLDLDWDRALLAHEAAWMLGATDPEIAAWVSDARTILRRLGAVPMLDRLDEAVARPRAGGRAGTTTGEVPEGVAAQPAPEATAG
jgi:hypothetical protein